MCCCHAVKIKSNTQNSTALKYDLRIYIQELKIESVLLWLNLVAKKAKNIHNPLSSYLITGHIKIPAIWHAFESRFLCILCAWIGDVGYIAQQIGFKPNLKQHSYLKSPVFSRDISSILQLKGNAFIGYRTPNTVGRKFSSLRSKTITIKNRNKGSYARSCLSIFHH